MSPPVFDPAEELLPFAGEAWRRNEDLAEMEGIGRAFEVLALARNPEADRPGGPDLISIYGDPGLEEWEGTATCAYTADGGPRRIYATTYWGDFIQRDPMSGRWSVLDCLATTPRDCVSAPGSTELNVDELLQRLDAAGGEQPLAADLATRIRARRETTTVRARDLGAAILWGAELVWDELAEAASRLN